MPDERRHSKWDKKAELRILVGYAEVDYRTLINNRVIVARHIDIIEDDIKCIGFSEDKGENDIDEIIIESGKTENEEEEKEGRDREGIIGEELQPRGIKK